MVENIDRILQDIINASSLQSVPAFDTLLTIMGFVFWGFLIADIFMILFFVFAFSKAWSYRPELEVNQTPGTVPTQGYSLRTDVNRERWKAIVKKAQNETPDSLRIAVIDADGLVNDILRQMGFEGKHMADRLSQIDPEDVTTLQRVWRGHRVRNDLVHTPGYFLSDEQARRSLEDFEAFLREVEAI
jgi:hypothetical protein